ncbi:acetyltransferase [Intrasporangium oryzae NRRL B-24470]|uniref:Acetyltransferase n=1 Tax=Intrasporangium oryzae NRRL B-24470 TaxID=1386089 RepID=W9GE18_9MICO|nr:GNAT family N-acetyltransferase [Intrasporangium oryzae]EWT03048.1 acetyltransferase [Intrasporangium oryzae NRRL B-24470]
MTDAAGHTDIRARLEAYYDLAPRANAEVEQVGPFTLFVARPGAWPYYARPRLGLDPASAAGLTKGDVTAVLARQEELDVPRALEWVHETTPALLDAARGAGMTVEQCPLLVLDGDPVAAQVRQTVRPLPPDDPDIGLVEAAIGVGFGAAGTQVGPESLAERDAQAAAQPERATWAADRIASGRWVLIGAFDADAGPVGGGSHNPRGTVSEIVGVAVLPAFRRRGIAAALTAALAHDGMSRGITTVFCSAQDDAVARVYEGVGFRRVGTACIAELA